jgi:PAS domain S-box-containing protein
MGILHQTTPVLRPRKSLLRWTLPIVLGLLAVFYEIGPGRWIHDDYGVSIYFDLDIAFYGLIVPLLTFAVLTLLNQWLAREQEAERKTRVSEQRLAAIAAASADAIIGLDATGRVESWNSGAELLFSRSAPQAQGRTLAELLGGGEAIKVEFDWLTERVRQTGYVRGHETVLHTLKGREITVELTATQLADDSGQSLGMSVILRDVTDRKHRDDEIRRLNASLNEQVAERTRELADKVEELGRANAELRKLDQMRTEFVSVVSHQIRAPLTNMRGAIERMESDCCVINATCARMFTILDQQAARLDGLVKDVLNAARIEAGQLALQCEPISITPVVQQAVEQIMARAASGETRRLFRVAGKPGLPLVFADRDRVAEVLANLLDNADKYSPADKEVVVDLRADQTEVTVSVRDWGRGLPPNDLERVFEKFYRADSSDSQTAYGYGLGLYVCCQLVTAHGGRIWAENASDGGANGGAIFSFTLPIADSP